MSANTSLEEPGNLVRSGSAGSSSSADLKLKSRSAADGSTNSPKPDAAPKAAKKAYRQRRLSRFTIAFSSTSDENKISGRSADGSRESEVDEATQDYRDHSRRTKGAQEKLSRRQRKLSRSLLALDANETQGKGHDFKDAKSREGEEKTLKKLRKLSRATLPPDHANEEEECHTLNSPVKIALLGEAGVGKSALAVRFITQRFITEYSPTLEGTYNHHITVDDDMASFSILDTAGQSSCDGHILWADAFVLVYSVTSKESLDAVKGLRESIVAQKTGEVPVAIVGNKRDLKHFREVSLTEGQTYAEEAGATFFELSCAEDVIDTKEVFAEVYRQVRSSQEEYKKASAHSKKGIVSKMFHKKDRRSKP